MQIDDALGLLMEVPPMLASQWAAWFVVGLLLSIWGRREKSRPVDYPSVRQQSGVRPAARPQSGVRPPVAVRAAQAEPASSGDAFAELEALLEQPTGLHRTPGESSHLAEAESGAEKLQAPQSLP